jgi:hypothetical protein
MNDQEETSAVVVPIPSTPMSEYEKYIMQQEACGLCIGDKVRVTRKADTHEQGWDNSWEPDMDKSVGCIGTIIQIPVSGGIEMEFEDNDDSYGFPFFVLEKIDE